MKTKILIAVSIVAAAVLIAYSQIKPQPFAPAADFPREALIYVQIADLPAAIKLWNESEFKDKYLESANFRDFQNRHLGRKLASRWREFNDAAGFSVDLELLSSVAADQAALAIYDVGKLEFVFIAPVSDELFAATNFALNRGKFTEETLSDGTVVYRVKIEADHGRQKQELIFAQVKGRFVAATSEKLLAQTLNNINGGKTNNRLLDEPDFALLSREIAPHTATVWLDQTALNDDYYFKRYWLMSDVKDLKNVRAGIFDFEMQPGKFIERRKFLLNETVQIAPFGDAESARMLAFVPSDAPFYRMRTATAKTINEAIEKTIYARRVNKDQPTQNRYSRYYSFDDNDDYSSGDYYSLGEKYDEAIDETDEAETFEKRKIEIDFSKNFQSSKPRAILTLTEPKILPAPLFAEFQNAAVFDLEAGASFDRAAFETAIAAKFAAQTTVAASPATLNWETKTENGDNWRELSLPMLGWNVAYAVRGDVLILTDGDELLKRMTAARDAPPSERQAAPFNALTVVNFAEKENAYDRVFDELNRKKAAGDFFTENVSSLLDSISEIEKVEIKEFYSQNILNEEIIFILRDKE